MLTLKQPQQKSLVNRSEMSTYRVGACTVAIGHQYTRRNNNAVIVDLEDCAVARFILDRRTIILRSKFDLVRRISSMG